MLKLFLSCLQLLIDFITFKCWSNTGLTLTSGVSIPGVKPQPYHTVSAHYGYCAPAHCPTVFSETEQLSFYMPDTKPKLLQKPSNL